MSSRKKTPAKQSRATTLSLGKSPEKQNQDHRLGHWSDDEEERYLRGIALYGMDFHKLEAYIGTRDQNQIRSYYRRNRGKPDHPPVPVYAPGMRGRPPKDTLTTPAKSPGKRVKLSSTSPGTPYTPGKRERPQKMEVSPTLRGASSTPGKRGRLPKDTTTLTAKSPSKKVKLNADSSGATPTAKSTMISSVGAGDARKAKTARSSSKSTPSAKKTAVARGKITEGSTLSSNDVVVDISPPPVPPGSGRTNKSLSSMKDAASSGDGHDEAAKQQDSENLVEKPEIIEDESSPMLGGKTTNRLIAIVGTYMEREGIQMAVAALLGFLLVVAFKYVFKVG